MSGVLETRLITPRNASFKATNWQDSPYVLRGVQIKLSKPLKFKELAKNSLITTSTLALFGLHVHLPTKIVLIYCPGNDSFAVRKNIYELSDIIDRTRSNDIFEKEEDGESEVSVEDLMEEFRQLEEFHKIKVPEEVFFPSVLRSTNRSTLSHYMNPVPLLPIYLGVSLYENRLVVPIDFADPNYESLIMSQETRLVFFQKIYSVLDTGRLIVSVTNQDGKRVPDINRVVHMIRHHGEIFEETDSDNEEEYTLMDKILDCYTQYPHVVERIRTKLTSQSPGRLTPQQLSALNISRPETRKQVDMTPTRVGVNGKRDANQPVVSLSKIRIFNSENRGDSSSSDEAAANQTVDSVHREMQLFVSGGSSSSPSSSPEGESMKFRLDRKALLKNFNDRNEQGVDQEVHQEVHQEVDEKEDQEERESSGNESDNESDSEDHQQVKVYTSALTKIQSVPQKAAEDPITSSLPKETEVAKTPINTWKETRVLPSSQDSLDKHCIQAEASDQTETSRTQINVHKSSSQVKQDIISSSNERQLQKNGERENNEEIVSSNESRKKDQPSPLNKQMSATQEQIAQAIEIDSDDMSEKGEPEPLQAPHTQRSGNYEELPLSSSDEEAPLFRSQAKALLKKKIRDLSFSDDETNEPQKKKKSPQHDLQLIAREEYESARIINASAPTLDINQVVQNLGQRH